MHKVGLITVLFLALVLSVSGCGSQVESAAIPRSRMEGVSQSVLLAGSLSTKGAQATTVFQEPVIAEPVGLTKDPGESMSMGPFTGTEMQTFAVPRPMMVIVENSPAARPQCGLEDASVVYEFLVEGGISRFLALYYERFPERVGPVRSARPYFVHTALEYQALLLHAGASVEAYSEMAKTQIVHLDEIKTQGYYWRDSVRKAPHNLYTGLKQVKTLKSKTVTVQTPRFRFALRDGTVEAGKMAREITLSYWGGYTVRYQYDEAKRRYLRYIGKELHLMEDGKKLYADNIFVQYVDTKVTDAEGRLSMKMDGKGKAILFKDGLVYIGSWVKEQMEQTRFLQSDGTDMILNPGQTWIQVVPISTGVDYQ